MSTKNIKAAETQAGSSFIGFFSAIDGWLNSLISVTGGVSGALLFLMAIFVFFNVVTRAIAKPIPWLFSGTSYSMVAMAFIAGAYALREGEHIKVDVIRRFMLGRSAIVLDIISFVVIILFSVYLGWNGVLMVADSFHYHIQSNTAGGTFDIWILQLVIPLGCFLLLIQSIRMLVKSVYNLKNIPFKTSKSLLISKPYFIFPVFAAAIILGIYLLTSVNTLLGIFVFLITILFAGVPVAFALATIGIFALFYMLGANQFSQLPIIAFQAMNNFPLTAAPLFILGGFLMAESKAADRIFEFVEVWFRSLPAPLLLATIATGGIFCAITGSSVAAHATMAVICLPLLFARGYDKALAVGAIAGSTVGTLIPPSNGFILFGVVTNASIGQLFMAGLMPGIMLFCFYFAYVIIRALIKKEHFRDEVSPDMEHGSKWKLFRMAIWGLLAPIIMLGGIYLGIFTPTEAAGVLIVYALIVGFFIMRTLNWQAIKSTATRSTKLSLMILFIVIGAMLYGAAITQSDIMNNLVTLVKASSLSPLVFLIIVFIILQILGMFLESVSILMITLPITFPIAMALGINPLWFGVFYIINQEVGLLTPPVGLNLFVLSGASKLPTSTVIRGTFPFMLMMVLTIIVIYIFPQIVTWLPSTMYAH